MKFENPPRLARYIKLGQSRYEDAETCLRNGEIFVHFGTSNPELFALARKSRWSEFQDWRYKRELERVKRGELEASAAKSNATSATNQVRALVEDDGQTLWFTFHDGRLHWAFLSAEPPGGPDSERGFVRKVLGSWSDKTVDGQHLLPFDRLSGRLTRTAAYRGTTCAVNEDARDYLWRRLWSTTPEESSAARLARAALLASMVKVIRRFTPKDFELLSELVLTSVGWRRLSLTGAAMPYIDMVLEQPLDRRVLGAQVKSVLDRKEFDEFFSEFERSRSVAAGGPFHAGYFIYHTDPKGLAGVLSPGLPDNVKLIGPEMTAELALRAGLVDWVIERIE